MVLGTWRQQIAKQQKKTVKLYGVVPSLLQSHTVLKQDCEFNCEIRDERSSLNICVNTSSR